MLGRHVSAVEALLRAGAYPCFRDNHLISPLHLASTQAGDRDKFRRIAELLGPSALLARDEVCVIFRMFVSYTCSGYFLRPDEHSIRLVFVLSPSIVLVFRVCFLLREFSNFCLMNN